MCDVKIGPLLEAMSPEDRDRFDSLMVRARTIRHELAAGEVELLAVDGEQVALLARAAARLPKD